MSSGQDNTVTAEETPGKVEDEAYILFASRILKGLGRRAGRNLSTLNALDTLGRELAELLTEAVHTLRSGDEPASWADIGFALGITRQAAQQRFGGEGSRRPGGQPGDLR